MNWGRIPDHCAEESCENGAACDAGRSRRVKRVLCCAVQTIGRLGLNPAPPVAVVPLGTGNDLARSFGWGGAFDKRWIKDHAALHRTLGWFGQAAAATLDRWRLRMTAPGQGFFTRKKPYGFTTDGPPEVLQPPHPPLVMHLPIPASGMRVLCLVRGWD